MSYIPLVTVVDGLDDLAPEELGLELGHLAVGLHLEVPVQAAAVDELHDEEDLLVRLKHLVQLRNVLVVQLLHNLHLALDTFASVGLHQFCLLVDLDSDFLVERAVQAQTHHSVGTLTNPLSNEVVVQILDRTIRSAKLITCRLAVLEVLEHFILRVSIFLGLILGLLLLHLLLLLLGLVLGGFGDFIGLDHACSVVERWLVASLLLVLLVVLGRVDILACWWGLDLLLLLLLQVVHFDLSDVSTGNCSV